MRIRLGCRFTITCPAATPVLLLVHVHASRRADLLEPEALWIEPEPQGELLVDGEGNRLWRFTAPAGTSRVGFTTLVHDTGQADPVLPGAGEEAVGQLPIELYGHLAPSRYCDSDRLAPLAWSLFGSLPPGWSRVQAICDWVHGHLAFDYDAARVDKTASEALAEGRGVCRDFAHLAISLCRAVNIPARYATGYLGYTGLPVGSAPVDFSAWFEVWLGGGWHVFDARHNRPRQGRVLIARGRDAADVPFLRSFGEHRLEAFEVVTEDLPDPSPQPAPIPGSAWTG